MNVLVTGGCGFIGRHLVKELAARGRGVRVLDLADPPRPETGVDYHEGSVTDPGAVRRALAGIETVYHLAGIAHLWARDDKMFDLANRIGTETVLACAHEAGVDRIVHCSTEAILMPPRGRAHGPINEMVTLAPPDMPGPYTRSKLAAEHAAMQAGRNGLDVVVVNPTIPIGAGDYNMTPPAAMLDLLLAGKSPFYLDCLLNLVDVGDVAKGMILACERGRSGERYILGSDCLPMQGLMELLQRISGRPMPRHPVPQAIALAAGAISDWVSKFTKRAPAASLEGVLLALRSAPVDNGKARRELGYEPRAIEPALTEAVLWLLHMRNAARRGL